MDVNVYKGLCVIAQEVYSKFRYIDTIYLIRLSFVWGVSVNG